MDQRRKFEYRGFDQKEQIPHGTVDEEFGMPKHYCAGCNDWIFGSERDWRKHLKISGHRETKTTMQPNRETITWKKAEKAHHGAIRPTENPDISEHYCRFCEKWMSDIVWLEHLNKTGHRTTFPEPKKQ